MMNTMIAALALCLPAAASAAEGTVTTKTPAKAVAALVRYSPPKEWKTVEYANSDGADAVVRHEKLVDSFVVRVFGAPGSAYATPGEFLAGPAASSMGAAPAEDGAVEIAGRKHKAYRRRYPMVASDPHGHAAPALFGTELFVVLPPGEGGRFVVVSWQRASPAPDLERAADKAWAALLKSVRPIEPPRRKKK